MLQELEKPVVLSSRDRICGRLKTLIVRDRCQVGQRLPTSRELARHFNVGLVTAQEAFRMLAKEGLVSCEARRGTFVRRTLSLAEAHESGQPVIPTIGVLTGGGRDTSEHLRPSSDWAHGIIFGIQQGLMEAGCAFHAIPYHWRDEPISVAESRLARLAPALAGLILFPQVHSLLKSAERLNLTCVHINQFNHLMTSNFVAADYYGGSLEVGQLFGQLGLARVLFLKSEGLPYSVAQKENGLRDGLSAGGVSPNQVQVRSCGSTEALPGKETTAQYLRRTRRPPQAIYATGDFLALGAIKACQEHGLRVPEDVAVVGSTGLDVCEHSTPTLTTVQLPMIGMGREAAQMLLALIEKKEKHAPGKILPAHLALRGSTPRLPESGRHQ